MKCVGGVFVVCFGCIDPFLVGMHRGCGRRDWSGLVRLAELALDKCTWRLSGEVALAVGLVIGGCCSRVGRFGRIGRDLRCGGRWNLREALDLIDSSPREVGGKTRGRNTRWPRAGDATGWCKNLTVGRFAREKWRGWRACLAGPETNEAGRMAIMGDSGR